MAFRAAICALILGTAAAVGVSCGDDYGDDRRPPQPGTSPTASPTAEPLQDWTSVTDFRECSGTCHGGALDVEPDGDYLLDDEGRGRVTAQELEDLRQAVNAVLDQQLDQVTCAQRVGIPEQVFRNVHIHRDDGSRVDIIVEDFERGYCFRGDAERANRLGEVMGALVNKYVPLSDG